MKTKNLSLLLSFVIPLNMFSQTPVNKTTVEIPKEFKKAKIALIQLSNDNQLNVVLSQEKKKEVELYQFTFDQNVKQTSSQAVVSVASSDESSRNAISNPASVGQDGIVRFVRVVPSSFWGQMILEKGYMQKDYLEGIYIGEEFVTEREITGIKTEDGRKIIPVSEMHVGIGGETQTTKTLGLDNNSGFLAVGDLIAVGGVFPKLVTQGRLGVGSIDTYIDYCIVKADAKKLDVDKITMIPFKYVQQTELCREVNGKKLMLITKDCPLQPKDNTKVFYNKDSQTRTITIINKEGTVDKQINFEGMPDMFIMGVEMMDNGTIYVLARVGKNKEMGLGVIKIKNDQVVYTQKTLASEMEKVVVKPSNEKKTASLSKNLKNINKKNNWYRGALELENGNFVAVYQEIGLPGRMYYLQFDNSGKLIKQYTHGVTEDFTASADKKTVGVIDFFIRQNYNSGFYPIIMEKTKDGSYLKICKIDGNTGTMSNFIAYGRKSKEDSNEYYLDQMNPMIDTPDGGMIMVGRSSNRQVLYVEKIKFE